MLSELRVLLPSAQLISAFLITIPFNNAFAELLIAEKTVFLITFMLSLSSLILLSAPAIQHRLVRPLVNRERFKHFASMQILAGALLLASALIMATQLVLAQVFGHAVGIAFAAVIGVIVFVLWWVLPKALKMRGRF